MYRIKLIKGLSYAGHGITATAKKPIIPVEDEFIAKKLLASGHFELVEFVDNKKSSADKKPKDIKKMNTAELTEKAEELGVDISKCKTNSERADLIIAALEDVVGDNADGEGDDGESDFGDG